MYVIRLFNNCVNEDTLNEAAGPYNATLKENRHGYILNTHKLRTSKNKNRGHARMEEEHEAVPTHGVSQKKRKKYEEKEK